MSEESTVGSTIRGSAETSDVLSAAMNNSLDRESTEMAKSSPRLESNDAEEISTVDEEPGTLSGGREKDEMDEFSIRTKARDALAPSNAIYLSE